MTTPSRVDEQCALFVVPDVLRLAIELSDLATSRPEPHIASAHYQAISWTNHLLDTALVT